MHSIIERLDVLEDARTCLMLIPKVALVHQLILPFREEVFGNSVVQTVSFAAHGRCRGGAVLTEMHGRSTGFRDPNDASVRQNLFTTKQANGLKCSEFIFQRSRGRTGHTGSWFLTILILLFLCLGTDSFVAETVFTPLVKLVHNSGLEFGLLVFVRDDIVRLPINDDLCCLFLAMRGIGGGHGSFQVHNLQQLLHGRHIV